MSPFTDKVRKAMREDKRQRFLRVHEEEPEMTLTALGRRFNVSLSVVQRWVNPELHEKQKLKRRKL